MATAPVDFVCILEPTLCRNVSAQVARPLFLIQVGMIPTAGATSTVAIPVSRPQAMFSHAHAPLASRAAERTLFNFNGTAASGANLALRICLLAT